MVSTRRMLMALCLTACALSGMPAASAGDLSMPYTDAAFEAAQKAGKPILIDTYADWCEICTRQKPILEKLLRQPKFKDVTAFRVDFARQKDVMRKFRAPLQSTLIVFRDGTELGRSTGETQPEWIEDLLDKLSGKGTS